MILKESEIRQAIRDAILETQRISTNPFMTSPFSPDQAVPKPVITLRISDATDVASAKDKCAQKLGPSATDYSISCEEVPGGFACIANRVNDPVDSNFSY